MEVLCRLSYSGGWAMIATVLRAPAFLLVVVPLVAGACSGAEPDRPLPYPERVRFGTATGGAVLHVAVATTDAERQRGLMHVDSLPQDAGMAFVWTDPTDSGFWMRDTLIPLSVAFVDHRGRIVTIRDMAPCTSDPCPVYEAARPFVLAVEANRGWFEEHGVAVGDPAVLEASS
jgi:uncharacterized membrane protein (UPF0127 family)